MRIGIRLPIFHDDYFILGGLIHGFHDHIFFYAKDFITFFQKRVKRVEHIAFVGKLLKDV